MAAPGALDNLKAAYDGIGNVPKEVRDFTLGETFEVMAHAGACSAKAASAIKG